jgi:hypothetical protein
MEHSYQGQIVEQLFNTPTKNGPLTHVHPKLYTKCPPGNVPSVGTFQQSLIVPLPKPKAIERLKILTLMTNYILTSLTLLGFKKQQ